MATRQYDRKTAWLHSGMTTKDLLARGCVAGYLGSFTAIHTIHPVSKITLRAGYDAAGLRSSDDSPALESRSRIICTLAKEDTALAGKRPIISSKSSVWLWPKIGRINSNTTRFERRNALGT